MDDAKLQCGTCWSWKPSGSPDEREQGRGWCRDLISVRNTTEQACLRHQGFYKPNNNDKGDNE